MMSKEPEGVDAMGELVGRKSAFISGDEASESSKSEMKLGENSSNSGGVDNGKVMHNYEDHAHYTEEDFDAVCKMREEEMAATTEASTVSSINGSNHNNNNNNEQNFPMKLHFVLDEMERDGQGHIASWQEHGRCFIVHKPDEFAKQILPFYFRQGKFASFQRQLNLYAFQRITAGRDRGAYYHQLFLRGKVFLCRGIRRCKIKGKGARKASNPETEPDFYSMPAVPFSKKKAEAPVVMDESPTLAKSKEANRGTEPKNPGREQKEKSPWSADKAKTAVSGEGVAPADKTPGPAPQVGHHQAMMGQMPMHQHPIQGIPWPHFPPAVTGGFPMSPGIFPPGALAHPAMMMRSANALSLQQLQLLMYGGMQMPFAQQQQHALQQQQQQAMVSPHLIAASQQQMQLQQLQQQQLQGHQPRDPSSMLEEDAVGNQTQSSKGSDESKNGERPGGDAQEDAGKPEGGDGQGSPGS